MTNYERIMRMSPHELAAWLAYMECVCECCDTPYHCETTFEEVNNEHCAKKILCWMNQEVDDGE